MNESNITKLEQKKKAVEFHMLKTIENLQKSRQKILRLETNISPEEVRQQAYPYGRDLYAQPAPDKDALLKEIR